VAWDPSKHPRDPRTGRFTRSLTRATTAAERRRASSASSSHRPAKHSGRAQAKAYYSKLAPTDLTAEQLTALAAFGTHATRKIQGDVRSGRTDSPTVKALDAAMRPLPEDVTLTKRVRLATLQGVSPADLVGRKVKDAGYSAASLTPATKRSDGEVRMRIKAPAGTPAVVAPGGSGDVLLPRDTELVVEAATPDGKGGWTMDLVVLPTVATAASGAGGGEAPTLRKRSDGQVDVLVDGEPVGTVGRTDRGPKTRPWGYTRPDGTPSEETYRTRKAAADALASDATDAGQPAADTTGDAEAVPGAPPALEPEEAPTPLAVNDPAASTPAATARPATPEQIQQALQDAYAAVVEYKEQPVWLAEVRRAMDAVGVSRGDQDAQIRAMVRDRRMNVFDEANQKATSAEELAGAIRLGGQDKTVVTMEGVGPAQGSAESRRRIAEARAFEAERGWRRVTAAPPLGSITPSPTPNRQEPPAARGFPPGDPATMQAWADANFNPDHEVSIRSYSADYQEINGPLREGVAAGDEPWQVADLDAAMSPTPTPVTVHRWTGTRQFRGIDLRDPAARRELVGKTITDRGYTSTSLRQMDMPPLEIDDEPVKLIVDVPAGSPALYLGTRSAFAREQELLLARSTRFRVVSVEPSPTSYGEAVIRLEVLP